MMDILSLCLDGVIVALLIRLLVRPAPPAPVFPMISVPTVAEIVAAIPSQAAIAETLTRVAEVTAALVPPPPPPIPADALGARAWELVREQDTVPDRSGESKRHQVYARLIKEFPDVPKRVLARAIEDAVGR